MDDATSQNSAATPMTRENIPLLNRQRSRWYLFRCVNHRRFRKFPSWTLPVPVSVAIFSRCLISTISGNAAPSLPHWLESVCFPPTHAFTETPTRHPANTLWDRWPCIHIPLLLLSSTSSSEFSLLFIFRVFIIDFSFRSRSSLPLHSFMDGQPLYIGDVCEILIWLPLFRP